MKEEKLEREEGITGYLEVTVKLGCIILKDA